MKGRARPTATVCPLCGHVHTHATGAFVDATPSPGDATLCIRCGAVSVFDDRLALRPPTAAEWAELEHDPQIIAATTIWRRALLNQGGANQ